MSRDPDETIDGQPVTTGEPWLWRPGPEPDENGIYIVRSMEPAPQPRPNRATRRAAMRIVRRRR